LDAELEFVEELVDAELAKRVFKELVLRATPSTTTPLGSVPVVSTGGTKWWVRDTSSAAADGGDSGTTAAKRISSSS
jgi:hypothetical protein